MLAHKSSDKRGAKYIEGFIREHITPALAHLSYGNILDHQKMDIYVSEDVPTACVMYDYDKEKHLIFIGSHFDNFNNINNLRDISNLVKMLLIHECGHVLFTERDLEEVNKRLNKIGVSFNFLNLAEDARIEHLIKKHYHLHTGEYKYLERADFTETPEEKADMKPEAILFAIINTENKRPIHGLLYTEVYEFYERFIAAKDTFEVVDICEDWKNHFHNPYANPNMENEEGAEQDGSSQEKDGSSEGKDKASQNMDESLQELMDTLSEDASANENEDSLSDKIISGDGSDSSEENGQEELNKKSLEDLDGPKTEEEMIEKILTLKRNSICVTDSSQNNKHDLNVKIDTSEDFSTFDGASNAEDIFTDKREPEEFDEQSMKEEIIPLLQKIKAKTKHRTVAVKKPTKRFNTKNLARGMQTLRGEIYKNRVEQTLKMGDKKITIMVDASGSMQGFGNSPIEKARTLLIAFNRLAQMFPSLDVTVIGTKIKIKSLYQSLKLPNNEKALLSIQADGRAEGLGYALIDIATNKQANTDYDLEKQDVLLVITDGNMGRKDISELQRGMKEYLNKECKKIGIYVGDERMINKDMENWFDIVLADTSLATITEEVVDFINEKNKKVSIEKENSPENNTPSPTQA